MGVDFLQPGAVVADQYRIDRLIGSGGYARVYRAVELDLDRTVALKVLTPAAREGLRTAESVQKRFYREARLISKLDDPRTITIYGYDMLEAGQLYMVLEYVEGTNLSTLIDRDGPMPPARVSHLLEQILLGLRNAHAHGVLHRDIKPSNVMVYDRYGEPDCVKLLDFGIAKAVMAEAEHAAAQDLTLEGTVIGTPRYMSPEQLLGRPLNPASDLFSTGILVYEMFTGRSPYDTHDRNEMYRRMQQFADSLGPLDSAPAPLATAARGMLQPSLDRRFDRAEKPLDVLLDAGPRASSSHTGDVSAPNSSPATNMARPKRAAIRAGGRPAKVSGAPPRRPADGSDPITFPLGFDPAGATPSTEMTGVDIAGGHTRLVDISQEKLEQDRSREQAQSRSEPASSAPRETAPTGSIPAERPDAVHVPTDSRKGLAARTGIGAEQLWRLAIAAILLAAIIAGIALWWSSTPDPPSSKARGASQTSTDPSGPNSANPAADHRPGPSHAVISALDDARRIVIRAHHRARRVATPAAGKTRPDRPSDDSPTARTHAHQEAAPSRSPRPSDKELASGKSAAAPSADASPSDQQPASKTDPAKDTERPASRSQDDKANLKIRPFE